MKKVLSLLLVTSLSIFAAEIATSEEIVPQKVLLAMEETPFKTSLIEKMKILLTSKSVSVTIIEDHKSDLEAVSASEYDAIFITISGVNSTVRPWVSTWLETNSDYGDRVIVHVTKTRVWDDGLTVDAVSSASSRGDVDSLAQSYVSLLEQKLTASSEE